MKKLIFTQIFAMLFILSASSQESKEEFFENYIIKVQQSPLNTELSEFGPCIVGGRFNLLFDDKRCTKKIQKRRILRFV